MLSQISSPSLWNSFFKGGMFGIHHHPGFNLLDEDSITIKNKRTEEEDKKKAHERWEGERIEAEQRAHERIEDEHREAGQDDFFEEFEFELLLESTLMHNAWYAAPFYTYGYHEEDQFMDTLNTSYEYDDDFNLRYISPWAPLVIEAPEPP